MSISTAAPLVPILLLSRRKDVAVALEGDPGASRYALTIEDPKQADFSSLDRFRCAIVDFPGVDDPMAVSRKLRRVNESIEVIAIVAEERQGVEAIRLGAFDFLRWPPPEAAELWTLVSALVAQVGPPLHGGASGSIAGYKLLQRLGTGGMADVYLGQRPGQAPLVVKCMRPEIAEDVGYVEMFLEEARISRALDHPNIVRVLDAGGTEAELYMAMEYIAGKNLDDIGRAAGWRFPFRIAAHIVAEIAGALDYAHGLEDERGAPLKLIHRDVNPPNVLIREDGVVKLADFGIAKTAQHHSRTTQGVIRGKLEYMSPEQAEGGPLDARTDVFSLGTVLYLLLTATHPFKAATTLQTLMKIRQARCERPSTIVPEIPKELDSIVMNAMERDRELRYKSAAALENDLRNWLHGQPVTNADVAEFVRDVATPREGVVPGSAGGRVSGRTVRQVPGAVTVLSPPSARASEDRTVLRESPRRPEGWSASGSDDPTGSATPVAEPTVTAASGVPVPARAVARGEPSNERTLLRETSEPDAEDTEEGPAVRAPARGAEITMERPLPIEDRSDTRIGAGVLSEPPREDTVSRETDRSTHESGSAAPQVRQRSESSAPIFPPAARARMPLALEDLPPWALPAGGTAAGIVFMLVLFAAFTGGEDPPVPVRRTPTPIALATPSSPPPTRPPPTPPPATPRPATPMPTPTPRLAVVTPPPPTRTPVPPLRKGTVSIWVIDGWAAVSVDGRSLGVNAPVVGLELTEGKHRITLENAPMRARKDYDVQVVAGQELKLTLSVR